MAEIDMREPHADFPLSPHWQEWRSRAIERAAPGWIDLVQELRRLQDAFAGSAPPQAAVEQLTTLFVQARELLGQSEVGDADQLFGRLLDLPGRAQTLSPPVRITGYTADTLTAETVFGRFYSGSNDAVHGGAVALMFDEAFGRLADLGDRPRSRTAGLYVDYRSVTPVDELLCVQVRVSEDAGRKRRLAGTLKHGDRLCAEATALFITLRPGQP
jgi:acyl-coenzyme A thioesterase PaaI-like protein